MRQGKGQISQPLHTEWGGRVGGGVTQKSLSQEGGGPAFQGWLHLCLEWLPDCSFSDQLLPTAISQTLPLQTQCPALREIRQVVSWRLRCELLLTSHRVSATYLPMATHLSASSPFRMHPNLSREFLPMFHLFIFCKPPSPFWHPPSGLYIAEYRMFRRATSEKGVWSFLRSTYSRWCHQGTGRIGPFKLIIFGAPGPATAQQRILDSIEVEKMTLRRGCENTGEGWSHLSPGSNGLRCEQWTGRHCLLCGGDKGLPQFRLLRSACL